MTDLDLREQRLDDLLRPALVVDPPPAVQQSILAAVLAAPVAARAQSVARPARSVSPLAYLAVGAALIAYVGLVSWLQGMLGDVGWLGTLAIQLFAVADLVLGQSLPTDPIALTWMVLQWAPWLLLLPIAILLWERDRAVPMAA